MLIQKSNYFLRTSKFFLTSTFLVIVQSCSNTPIGQDLSNSFDDPVGTNSEVISTNKKIKTVTSKASRKKLKDRPELASDNKKIIDKKIFSSANEFPKKNKRKERFSSFTPQPYRITIKLSAANPSAPAETVTKALRTAGVRFEVEMIELIEDKTVVKDSRSGRLKR